MKCYNGADSLKDEVFHDCQGGRKSKDSFIVSLIAGVNFQSHLRVGYTDYIKIMLWFSHSWQLSTTLLLAHSSLPLVGWGGESEEKCKTHGLG